MKYLPFQLKTPIYIQSVKDFGEYLYGLGYHILTCKTRPSNVVEFLHFMEERGVVELLGIGREDILNYREYLHIRPNYRRNGGLSISTINNQIHTLRLYFDYLEQSGQQTENPISSLYFPAAVSEEAEILTQAEIKQIYCCVQSLREIALLNLFYGCGLRRNEAEKLNTEDIHFKSRVLYVREGKGKKRRAIPITEKITKELKQYYLQERGTYISHKTPVNEKAFMLNKHGTRMKGINYLTLLKTMVKRMGIHKNVYLHSLRHSIAGHLLENGMSIESIREFLGHKNLETTQIYTRVSKELLKQIHLKADEPTSTDITRIFK